MLQHNYYYMPCILYASNCYDHVMYDKKFNAANVENLEWPWYEAIASYSTSTMLHAVGCEKDSLCQPVHVGRGLRVCSAWQV